MDSQERKKSFKIFDTWIWILSSVGAEARRWRRNTLKMTGRWAFLQHLKTVNQWHVSQHQETTWCHKVWQWHSCDIIKGQHDVTKYDNAIRVTSSRDNMMSQNMTMTFMWHHQGTTWCHKIWQWHLRLIIKRQHNVTIYDNDIRVTSSRDNRWCHINYFAMTFLWHNQ